MEQRDISRPQDFEFKRPTVPDPVFGLVANMQRFSLKDGDVLMASNHNSINDRKSRDHNLFGSSNQLLFASMSEQKDTVRQSVNLSDRSVSQFLREEPNPRGDFAMQRSSGQRISSDCMMLIDSYHERYNKSGILFGSGNSNFEMGGPFNRLSKE
jgi:hypothetical protein